MRLGMPFSRRNRVKIGVGITLAAVATAAVVVAAPAESAPASTGVVSVAQPRTEAVTPAIQPAGVRTVIQKRVVKRVHLKYAVTKRGTVTLAKGHKKLIREGRAGVAKVVYKVIYVNGIMAKKVTIKRYVVLKPRAAIVAYGIRPRGMNAGPAEAKAIAQQLLAQRGWSGQFSCLDQMWTRESGWKVNAHNSSGAHGIPQALPGSKMGAYGSNWQSDAVTQIKWGLAYIAGRYGTPCHAWSVWQTQSWY